MASGALVFRYPYKQFYDLGADYSDDWFVVLVPWITATVLFGLAHRHANAAKHDEDHNGVRLLLVWFRLALLVQCALLMLVLASMLWNEYFIKVGQHFHSVKAVETTRVLTSNIQKASWWVFGTAGGIAILAILPRTKGGTTAGWVILAAILAFFPWVTLLGWLIDLQIPGSRLYWWKMLHNPLMYWGLGLLSGIAIATSPQKRELYWLGPLLGWLTGLLAVVIMKLFHAGEKAFDHMNIGYSTYRALSSYLLAGLGSIFATAGLLLNLPRNWHRWTGALLAALGIAILTAILTGKGIR